jgi:predicted MPP superfamily phosphohydrolase
MAFTLGLAALLAPAIVVLYAFFVEPYSLELTRHGLAADVSQPLKIAHLSDLHSRGFGTRERQLVALLDQAVPDLIVVTGDLVDSGTLEPTRELFRRLRAPLGIWVVRGNSERARGDGSDGAFFKSVNAHLLDNQGVPVREDVWLAGLDDPLTGHPDLDVSLKGAPAASFKVALFHSPEIFGQVAGLFNLGLAGHTHGGQVRLPGLSSFWLAQPNSPYIAGWYTKNRSQLYVSRGIGTTLVPARFLSRPEVALIEISPN